MLTTKEGKGRWVSVSLSEGVATGHSLIGALSSCSLSVLVSEGLGLSCCNPAG